MSSLPPTIHACALVIGRHGVLIEGESGTGKSRLADALIDAANARRMFARWVADDRVILSECGASRIATPAPAIAGQAEHVYLGIVDKPHLEAARMDMVVRLLPRDPLERLPVSNRSEHGLPLVFAPQRALSVSVPLVMAALSRLP